MKRSLWAVVPAYNEAAVIGQTLRALRPYSDAIIVVDDGSADRTSAAAREAGAYVVRHAINLGQGAAIATGFAFALSRDATHVATFDADGQHDPHTIPLMLAALAANRADVVLASRFLGEAPGITAFRRVFLKAAVWLTNAQTGLHLTDTHNGLRLFTRDAAAAIRLEQPGMAHASEILSQISRAGLRVSEIATSLRYTEYSKAKGQPLSNSVRIFADLLYAAWTR